MLAGGHGTRLRSVVPDLPKPLAPVGGRPFLAILLEHLSRRGFASVVLSVGYKREAIQSAFGNAFAGLQVRYAEEHAPLGTGGAIRLAARQCADAQPFVLNGDSYVELDFAAMRAAHRQARSRLTVCTIPVADAGRYGRVLLEGSRITGFTEKGATGPGDINAGVYLIERNLLEELGLPDVFSFERDVLMARLPQLCPMAFRTSGTFIDIGVPEDYARAQELFAVQ